MTIMTQLNKQNVQQQMKTSVAILKITRKPTKLVYRLQ